MLRNKNRFKELFFFGNFRRFLRLRSRPSHRNHFRRKSARTPYSVVACVQCVSKELLAYIENDARATINFVQAASFGELNRFLNDRD